MIDSLPVTHATVLRDTPFARKQGWGVRYQVAPESPIVSIALYRETARLDQPLGIDEEMLQYFAKEFLADHRQAWEPLNLRSATMVGTVATIQIPDAAPEQLAVVVEFAMTMPDSVRAAPQLIFTDILRGLVFPDDLETR